MTCILGPVLNDEIQYYQLNNAFLSKHIKTRKHRFDLIISNNILYHFEIYRFIDKSRQVHCLLEDGSILIFSKKDKKLITVILPDLDLLNKYINKVSENLEKNVITKLIKCSKLNALYNVNENKLSEEDIKKYLDKKRKILNI